MRVWAKRLSGNTNLLSKEGEKSEEKRRRKSGGGGWRGKNKAPRAPGSKNESQIQRDGMNQSRGRKARAIRRLLPDKDNKKKTKKKQLR